MKLLFSRLIVCVSIIFSCVSCIAGNSNNPNNSSSNNISTTNDISINDTSMIPVISNAPVTIYVHNNTNSTVNGINFSAEYYVGGDVTPIALNQCSTIAANTRCELQVTPPELQDENAQDSILIKAEYQGRVVNRIISFIKINQNKPGIYFAPSPAFIKDKYVTLYVYAGDTNDYTINEFSDYPLTTTLLSNQILPLEVSAQSSRSLTIQGVNDSMVYSDMMSLSVTPRPNGALLTTGISPVIQTTSGATTGSIIVVNSGNQSTGALTESYPTGIVAASGTGACNLPSGLAAGASCKSYFSISNPGNGSGNIKITDTGSGGSIIAPNITWYNATSGILVQMSANPASLGFSQNSSESTLVTLTNLGPYTLTGITESVTTFSGSGTTVLSSNNCSSLTAGTSCTFVATVSDTVLETNKQINLKISGSYNNGSAQTYSRYLSMTYSAFATYAYIANSSSSVLLCTVNAVSGNFAGCVDSGAGAIFSTPQGIAINSGFVYIASQGGNQVVKCIESITTGLLSGCGDSGVGVAVFSNPNGIAINNGFVYVSNTTANTISQCTESTTTGLLSACVTYSSSPIALNSPRGIVINNSYAYVVSEGANQVLRCAVNPTTGALSPCVDSGAGATFSAPIGIAINNGFAYIPDYNANSISICTESATTGALSPCPQTAGIGLSEPDAVAINNGFAYITNFSGNTVTQCIESATTGALTSCNPTGSGFSNPRYIAITVVTH